VHRSLGAHISKVKSLRLDAWKMEEMRSFRAQGGNTAVNKRLAKRAARFAPSTRNNSYPAYLVRPDMSAGKPDISEYIRRKYHATGPPEFGNPVDGSGSRPREMPQQAPGPAALPGAGQHGRTCFQGVCFVEIMGIEISEERARDLRILGTLFLSLSVTMSLGSITAEPSSVKRASTVASWDPPERRELLWDCEERWLWCRVFDGAELMGLGQLAAEGRIDLRLLGEASNVEVALDLFATGGEDSGDEGAASNRGSRRGPWRLAPPGYFAEDTRRSSRGAGMHEDPSDPAVTGQCCGVARLRVTLVDMSGMDSGKKPGTRTSQGQDSQMARQNENSAAWNWMPRELQSGVAALLGQAPPGQRSGP